MSQIVENLIVGMGFDNKQFEAAAKVSMLTIGLLKEKLNFGGTKTGIDDIGAAAGRVNFGQMGQGVDGLSAKFVALSTVAITALTNITNKAVNAGTEMVKSLTVAPISSGFNEYELKMKSIQTILANTTKDYGSHEEALSAVTGSLEELNTYADKTIYNFGDMTKNIGLFTNAGIGVVDATAIIKGFSNEAAASGTSAEAAAGAAYQLSQGLSAGVLTLQDFKSLTNAGMGNANMKQGIIEIAQAMGAFEGTTVTAEDASKNFNTTLEKKWLTKDVMTAYFKAQSEGNADVNREYLKGIGLSDEQTDKFIKQQALAQDAATKVRTYTALVGGFREKAGSAWAVTSELLLGDFDEATDLFSSIDGRIGPMIDKMGKARNDLLQGWAIGGGRAAAYDGVQNVFEAILAVITPIKDAFRELFPPATTSSLINMSVAFRNFTEKLIVGSETADKIKRTFAGVFAIFSIGIAVVKGIFGVIGKLFGAFQGGSGGVLSVTASLGDFLVKVRNAVVDGGALSKIFETIGSVLVAPITLIRNFVSGLGSFVGSIGQATGVIKTFTDILFKGEFHGGGIFDEDSKVVDVLFRMREGFLNTMSAIDQFWNVLLKGDFVGGVFDEDSPIIKFLFDVRDSIEKFFSSDGIKLILTGAAGVGLGVAVKKMIQKAFKFGSDDGDSFFGTIKDAFGSVRDAFNDVSKILDSVTNSFKAMQQNLQAGTLLKIGLAIGIVALALKLLSTIDPLDLAVALGGVVGAMTTLLAGMAILSKISGAGALTTMPVLALSLTGLAAAILIMAVALKLLAGMQWDEIGRGLGALAGIMLILVGAAYGLSKAEGPMLRAGLAMIPFAIAIRLLISAVEDLGTMDWAVMLRGLAGLAGVVVAVGLGLNSMPKNMVSIGLGLLAVSASMLIFTKVIAELGSMSIASLIQGLLAVGIALSFIGSALQAMPRDMVAIGAGLLLVSGSLVVITAVIGVLGGMSLGNLIQGLLGMALALDAIAGALRVMSGTLSGAAALGIAAVSLALLLPSLVTLSLLSLPQLITGLLGLAGALAIIGAAGYLLTPVVPTLIGLGAALVLMGLGMMAAGVGASLLGAGLTALIGVVALGQAAIVNLVQIIPQMAAAFASAFISFFSTLANSAATLGESIGKLLGALLDEFIKLIPKLRDVALSLINAFADVILAAIPRIVEVITALIHALLQVIRDNFPDIVATGLDMMFYFLTAIRNSIPAVVQVVTDIIVAFIGALQNNLPRIVDAGFQFIIGFMNSLADSIRANLPLVGEAAGNIASAIIDGVVAGIKAGVGRVFQSLKDMATGALNSAKEALGIASPSKEFTKVGGWVAEGFVKGIDAGATDVNRAGAGLAQGLMGSVNDELKTLGGTAKTVFDILAFGSYSNNGGLLDEDSPIVNTLFNIREGFQGIGGAAQEMMTVFSRGDFTGFGPWEEDSPFVGTLFDIKENFQGIGEAAGNAVAALTSGNSSLGMWGVNSPIAGTLDNINRGMQDVGESASTAWDILNQGDFNGKGPWDEDSPIVSTLFDIREGFEEFNGIGQDAIQGLILGFETGTVDIVKAAQDMANQALDATRLALGIQSPSTKFKQIGEYSIEGLLVGLDTGGPAVTKGGNKVASGVVAGFTKGIGKEMPKAFASIFETLRTGTADAKFWGPNNPATIQLQNMNKALKEADLQLAAFYGEVNLADPASIEAYVQQTGDSLKYLTGLLNGLEKATNTAFEMLEQGKGIDVVLGDEAVLNDLLDGILSVIPGVEVMFFKLGLALVDGFLGIFFNTSVMGIVGDFITFAIRQIGQLFGIEFPIEEELDDANRELEDFLVNVEDTQGRFDKLTKAGIASLTTTLTEANEAVDALDTNPTITPILDLTEYNKAKGGMDLGVPVGSVSPATSAAKASTLYDDNRAYEQNRSEAAAAKAAAPIIFNQNNTTSKALDHIEIYKQTKNQLGNLKGVLGL